MSQDPTTLSYSDPRQTPSKPVGMAIASMVLGIISLFFCLWFIAFPCAILAVVFGTIAGRRARSGAGGGEGMAKAGFVMGCISLTIDAIFIVLIIGFGTTHFTTAGSSSFAPITSPPHSTPTPITTTPPSQRP